MLDADARVCMLHDVTTARRFYLFAGEHPSGGKVPTGNPATSTAYVYGAERTGTLHFVDGNLESHWPTIQARAATLRAIPTASSSPTSFLSSGNGPSATRSSRRSCAT